MHDPTAPTVTFEIKIGGILQSITKFEDCADEFKDSVLNAPKKDYCDICGFVCSVRVWDCGELWCKAVHTAFTCDECARHFKWFEYATGRIDHLISHQYAKHIFASIEKRIIKNIRKFKNAQH